MQRLTKIIKVFSCPVPVLRNDTELDVGDAVRISYVKVSSSRLSNSLEQNFFSGFFKVYFREKVVTVRDVLTLPI